MGALKYVHSAFDSDLSALPALNNDLILCAEGGVNRGRKTSCTLNVWPLVKDALIFIVQNGTGPSCPSPPRYLGW